MTESMRMLLLILGVVAAVGSLGYVIFSASYIFNTGTLPDYFLAVAVIALLVTSAITWITWPKNTGIKKDNDNKDDFVISNSGVR